MEAVKMELPTDLQTAITDLARDALVTVMKEANERESFPLYMKQKEVARYCNVSAGTIIRWEDLGLPFIVVEGVKRYYKPEIDNWMDSNHKK